MIRFFEDMAVNPLLLTGLLGGILAGLACGLIGPYVITRRIVFLVGAIAHIIVGGVGAVIFTKHRLDLDWLSPLHGAVVAALGAAVLVGLVRHYARERVDTLIGAMWAVGMAVGILLVKFTPGYQTEIMSYLFGNLAVVGRSDVLLLVVLDVLIVAAVLAWHKRLEAVCLDEEFAEIQGVSVLATNLVLLALVSLAVVALIRVVGLILVIALLTLPAATAARQVDTLGRMMLFATLLGMFCSSSGLVLAYQLDMPAGAVIILCCGGLYLISLLLRPAMLHSAPRLQP